MVINKYLKEFNRFEIIQRLKVLKGMMKQLLVGTILSNFLILPFHLDSNDFKTCNIIIKIITVDQIIITY